MKTQVHFSENADGEPLCRRLSKFAAIRTFDEECVTCKRCRAMLYLQRVSAIVDRK